MPRVDKAIQKLDEVSMKNIKEGSGPVDECICNVLNPPKESIHLLNTIRSAVDNLHMCLDATAKKLHITADLEGAPKRDPKSDLKKNKTSKQAKPGKRQKETKEAKKK